MAKVGACWSPSFSPDGTRVAFVSNMSGVPQIYVMPASGGFPEQVTALDDAVDEVDWSPTGEFLAFEVAPGGGLNTQVYVMKPDGSGMRRLTDGGKENNFMDRWSADGKTLAISSSRRDPATTDSYFIDLASGKMRMVAENKGIGGVQDISRDNRFAIINRLMSRGDNNLYLVEVATRQGSSAHSARGARLVWQRAVRTRRADDLFHLEQRPGSQRVRARAFGQGRPARRCGSNRGA